MAQTHSADITVVSSRGRYEHIDALRAVAVLMVVVAHAGLSTVVPGGAGVTIFFAISGFIITHMVLVERERTGAFSITDFYLRRLLKLAPPFVLLVLVPTAVYSLTRPISWDEVAGQVFFAFNWVVLAGQTQVLPGTEVVWSLAIEEQFYIAFALFWVMAVLTRRPVRWLTVLGLAVLVGALLLRVLLAMRLGASQAAHRIYYGTDTRADGIALGILAAVLFAAVRNGTISPRARSWLASNAVPVLAAVAYLVSLVIRDPWFRQTVRYTIQGAATSALILYGLLRTDGAVRRWIGRAAGVRAVQVVGLASYSIYLGHSVAMHLVRPWIVGWAEPLRLTTLVLVGTTVGIAAWKLVEVPVERYKSALMRRRAARRS